MPFCGKCGFSILVEDRFCPSCGAPVTGTRQSPPSNGTGVQPNAQDTSLPDAPTMVRNTPSYGAVNLEDLPAGHVIDDRYEVKVKLGQGGFGAVYRAHDRDMKVDKALKIIPDRMFGDRMAMESLCHEASVMVKLNHPNIVRVYDLHTNGSIKYIDMELVDGKSLTEILLDSPGRKVPEKNVRTYAIQITEGIAYAHSLNVIHRDIKPQNVMVGKDGSVKIMDFGIAETVRLSMSRISNKSSSGTLAYMSPEQIMGEPVGRQSDIYSAGAMLYELLSGRPPFWQGDIQYQIVHKVPPPVPGVSTEVNGVMKRCLAKNATDRFQTADELLLALSKDTINRLPISNSVFRRFMKFKMAIGIALVLVALVIGGGMMAFHSLTMQSLITLWGQFHVADDTEEAVKSIAEQFFNAIDSSRYGTAYGLLAAYERDRFSYRQFADKMDDLKSDYVYPVMPKVWCSTAVRAAPDSVMLQLRRLYHADRREIDLSRYYLVSLLQEVPDIALLQTQVEKKHHDDNPERGENDHAQGKAALLQRLRSGDVPTRIDSGRFVVVQKTREGVGVVVCAECYRVRDSLTSSFREQCRRSIRIGETVDMSPRLSENETTISLGGKVEIENTSQDTIWVGYEVVSIGSLPLELFKRRYCSDGFYFDQRFSSFGKISPGKQYRQYVIEFSSGDEVLAFFRGLGVTALPRSLSVAEMTENLLGKESPVERPGEPDAMVRVAIRIDTGHVLSENGPMRTQFDIQSQQLMQGIHWTPTSVIRRGIRKYLVL